MYALTRTIAVAASLATGCAGTIEDSGGQGSGTANGPEAPGTGNGTGAGTGTGTGTGTGSGNGTGTNTGSGSGTGTGTTPGSGTGTGTTPGTGPATTPGTGTTPGTATACTPGVPATSQLPRLSRVQYDNTVRDLIGIASQPSSMLAPDSLGSVDQRAWDGYQAAAEALSTQAMADATARAKVIPCAPTGDGAACAKQFIEQFGRRAFRRPLSAEEATKFQTLFTNRAQLTATGTFDEAAKLIVKAFLLSPSFLTRAELAATPEGQYFALNGYEVASRLSYMLWGSMPDEALFNAAAAGALANSAGILTEAQRMLKDAKARTKVSEFHQHYAHMGEGTRWSDISRDPGVYPAFSKAMVPLLSEETKRFFDHVVFDVGGTFRDLITSPIGFVNATLAPLYGLDATKYGADLVAVNLDPATRSGIFTRLGFLASNALYNRTSPILRGAFIQKEILCTPISPPPPDVESTPLPAVGATNRERVDAQTSPAACAGCHHALINPTGFAMEAYDAIGAYQATEGGVPINTSATVVIGGAAVPVTGPVDLMTKIANSQEAQRCYVKKWVQFAYERAAVTNEDSCTVENLASKLTQGGYTVLDLITDLTQSQSFRVRATEVAP